MNDATLAQNIQAKYGWPVATYEFGKRYTVTRWQCGCHVLEKHQMLTRGKPSGDPQWNIPQALRV